MALYHCSLRWFEASSCKPASRDLPSSLVQPRGALTDGKSVNSPDRRQVFDAADDPHDALTFLADQRIDLVDFLDQARPIPAEDSFIPLRFENSGDGVIRPSFWRFPCEMLL